MAVKSFRTKGLKIDRPSVGILIGAALAGSAVALTPVGTAIDRAIDPLRAGVVGRQASGNVMIVEMDAASIAAIKRWPWSRNNYAPVVDRLVRAGATSIVFDVDFSTPSDAAGDSAFAGSIARSGGKVVLPTFGQQRSSNDRRTIDALPIAILRREAALASVSIAPDTDGLVRDMLFGTMTRGVPRPSLASYIAGRSGTTETNFPIDMSIDPASIPRLSFVAVRDGAFDPAQVRGRNVLIGATAIEMGDRYGTSGWGVLPGVVVQAMAAETLIRGVPMRGGSGVLLVVALLGGIGMLAMRSPRHILAGSSVTVAGLGGIAMFSQHILQVYMTLSGALAIVATTTVACLARAILQRFALQRMTDEATQLPNRRAWSARPADQGLVSVALADIANYESLQVVLGPQGAADAILRVAERLRLSSDDGMVYRIGNGQLSFLLPRGHGIEDMLDGLRAILLQPVEVGGRKIDVVTTIGVTEGRGQALDRLLADAAMAADDARRAGTFWRRAASDFGEIERSLSLMGELDDAIRAGDIRVFYQPKLELKTDRIVSVEALVRWLHPERGMIGPDLFIPLAEQTDRIGPLTLHVVDQVLADVERWRVAGHDMAAAINISAKLLSSATFNIDVERALAGSTVPAASLIFEVTESAAMSDPVAAIAALRRYRDLGVAVSMDDYGTGQSTLTYIRELPLNELKIDRSFVQFAHDTHNDGVLVRSTIDLAHDLGIKVVAEGVEDEQCLQFLRASGCDMIQGYLISRPLPFADLIGFMHRSYDRLAARDGMRTVAAAV